MISTNDFTCKPPSNTYSCLLSPVGGLLTPTNLGKRKKTSPAPNRVAKKVKIAYHLGSCVKSVVTEFAVNANDLAAESELLLEEPFGLSSSTSGTSMADALLLATTNEDMSEGSDEFASQETVLCSQKDYNDPAEPNSQDFGNDKENQAPKDLDEDDENRAPNCYDDSKENGAHNLSLEKNFDVTIPEEDVTTEAQPWGSCIIM